MVEQTKYQVIKKIDKIEIRRYPSLVIARVNGYGDGGFNLLFDFITGNNRQQSKVEMTAPVLSETGSIAFVMPEKLSFEATPEPLDDRVKIVELPERLVAVLRFSGRWSSSIFTEKSKELLEILKKAGIHIIGNVFSMRYNGPFTPWFLRRNEVAIVIKD